MKGKIHHTPSDDTYSLKTSTTSAKKSKKFSSTNPQLTSIHAIRQPLIKIPVLKPLPEPARTKWQDQMKRFSDASLRLYKVQKVITAL